MGTLHWRLLIHQRLMRKYIDTTLSQQNKNIINKLVNVKYIFKQQHTNSQEYVASLLPYAIYYGCIFVYKPYWKKCLSLPFFSIPIHLKLLYVFMALPLSVSKMSKEMKGKW